MSKFNNIKSNNTINLAGGNAFERSEKESIIFACLTTFLETKFYESGEDRQTKIETQAKEIILYDELFIAKLAIAARTKFHLRSVTTLLLKCLVENGKNKDIIRKTIISCMLRPDDILELVAILNEKLTKQVKRAIRRSLYKFDRYQLAKYRGEGKNIKMVDVFNLCHPNPKFATQEQQEAWRDLINGDLKSFDTWETLISSAKTPEEAKLAWERLVKENKIGYMALLRNLNNLIKYGVSSEIIEIAAKKISDPEEVKKSKQLPFRFYSAYKAYKAFSSNQLLLDAISCGLDASLSNIPVFDGNTLIAIDASGSMNGKPIEIASLFGAALFKANSINTKLFLYDTDIKEIKMLSNVPMLAISELILHKAKGWGTNTSLVFHAAKNLKEDLNRIIILSDNESWVEDAQSAYNEYKRETGFNPYVYCIDIAGYGTSDINSEKVYHLCGWNDKIFDIMKSAENKSALIDYINNIIII